MSIHRDCRAASARGTPGGRPGWARGRFLWLGALLGLLALASLNLAALPETAALPPLRSSGDHEAPPFVLISPDGRPAGFAVDLLRAVLGAMGREVRFLDRPSQQLEQDLVEGRLQVLPLLARTVEREARFEFSEPYARLPGVIIVRQGDRRIRDSADLRDKDVLVVEGGQAEAYVRERGLSQRLVTTLSHEEALWRLAGGAGDAVVMDKRDAERLLTSLQLGLEVLHVPLEDYLQLCFAVRKGDQALLELLNRGLAATRADGSFERLRDKWLNPGSGESGHPWPYLLGIILGTLLLAGLIGYLWLGSLRRMVAARTRELSAANARLSYEFAERQQAENQLRASERQYRTLVEGLHEGIWSLDPGGRTRFVNPRLAEMLRYRVEELRDMPLQAILDPPSLSLWRHSLERNGQPPRGQLDARLVRKDGGFLHVALAVSPLYDEVGEYLGASVGVMDISERRQAAETLRRSVEETQDLYDRAPVGYHSLDQDGLFVRVNKTELNWLGYAAEELIGVKGFVDLLTPQGLATFQEDFRLLRERGWTQDVEYDLVRRDGTLLPVSVSASVVCDEAGQFVMTRSTVADITERRRAQGELHRYQEHLETLVAQRTAALQESEARLRQMAETIEEVFWLASLDFQTIHYVSPAFAQLWGSPCDALRAEPGLWLGALQAEDQPRLAQARRELAEGLPYSLEYRIPGPDGAQRWIHERGYPLRDEAGQVVMGTGAAHDISLRKAAELATEGARQEAERLARVRSEFLSNMSHEIRTPLNGVLGFAQIGLRENPEGKAHATFARILDAGQLLLAIVNDILDFSKIEAGRLELERVPFDLGGVVDRAIDLIAMRAYGKGLGLRVEEAADLPARWEGDALRLSQVLVNLLSNAVKFTERGEIGLEVDQRDGRLRMQVRDTGIGMTESQLDRLFSPFEQADGSTTRRFGGTGLGLAISKRLVDLMGGSLEVVSQPERGTCFTLVLPLKAIEPAPGQVDLSLVLAGLPEAESGPLAATLAGRGARVRLANLEEAFEPPSDRVVLGEPPPPATLAAVLDRGQGLALVCTPGTEPVLPPEARECCLILERPLRARHLLNPPAPAATATRQPGPRLTGISVLGAEDNAVNRMVVSYMVRSEGGWISWVEDGQQVLDRVRALGPEAYQLVLMDIQMPNMDGYTATRALGELAPELPVIGLTAHALPEERARCLEAGMVEHLTKPIDLELLVAAVLRHARRPAGAVIPKTAATDDQEDWDWDAAPPLPNAPGDDPPAPRLVDWRALEARFQGKRSFIRRIARISLMSQRDTPGQLRTLAQAGDLNKLAFLAHTVKGVSGNLLATPLYELARRTEQAARQGGTEAGPLAMELAERLETLLQELTIHVRQKHQP